MDKGIEQNSNDPIIIYNAACFYALIDEKTAAIENLKIAIDNGFRNYNYLKNDPDFYNLQNDPDFIALVESK